MLLKAARHRPWTRLTSRHLLPGHSTNQPPASHLTPAPPAQPRHVVQLHHQLLGRRRGASGRAAVAVAVGSAASARRRRRRNGLRVGAGRRRHRAACEQASTCPGSSLVWVTCGAELLGRSDCLPRASTSIAILLRLAFMLLPHRQCHGMPAQRAPATLARGAAGGVGATVRIVEVRFMIVPICRGAAATGEAEVREVQAGDARAAARGSGVPWRGQAACRPRVGGGAVVVTPAVAPARLTS
jgi:hypothetical protein